MLHTLNELQQLISCTQEEINQLEERLGKYKDECTHRVVKSHSSAVCGVCDRDFGWW